jgi:hypothetical protein
MLRPAVKQDDRRLRGIAWSRLGEVDPQPVGVDEAVLDALDLRQFVSDGIAIYLRTAGLEGRSTA